MRSASHATATTLIPSPIAESSIAGMTRRSTGRLRTRLKAPTCDRKIPGSSLLRVGLILSLGAVSDRPDVTIRVSEGCAVPAPLLSRRGLEDPCACLLGLRNHLVDARLAADDIGEDNAAEAAAVAVGAQANG